MSLSTTCSLRTACARRVCGRCARGIFWRIWTCSSRGLARWERWRICWRRRKRRTRRRRRRMGTRGRRVDPSGPGRARGRGRDRGRDPDRQGQDPGTGHGRGPRYDAGQDQARDRGHRLATGHGPITTGWMLTSRTRRHARAGKGVEAVEVFKTKQAVSEATGPTSDEFGLPKALLNARISPPFLGRTQSSLCSPKDAKDAFTSLYQNRRRLRLWLAPRKGSLLISQCHERPMLFATK